jgi:hypothetical protein
MHVHVPKPLHGWRAFAGEVGIIVLGVLIALGFEQVAQAIHWRYEAAKAQDALRNEAIAHYRGAAEMEVTAPCIDAQLHALEKRLLTQARGPVAPPVPAQSLSGKVFAAPNWVWSDDAWRSTESAGVAPHIDRDFRQKLANYYSKIGTLRDSDRETLLMGQKLRVLALPVQLDSASRAQLLEDLEETRGHYRFMHTLEEQIMQFDAALKWVPGRDRLNRIAASPTVVFCRAHHLPLAPLRAKYSGM